MPILNLESSQIVYLIIPMFFILLGVIIIILKKIKYDKKSIDIKEAPLEIEYILKDKIKREIIKKMVGGKVFISQLARKLGYEPAKTRFHLKKLENAGLVKQFKLARENYFSLTDKGLWCLKVINYYYPESMFDVLMNKFFRKKPDEFHEK